MYLLLRCTKLMHTEARRQRFPPSHETATPGRQPVSVRACVRVRVRVSVVMCARAMITTPASFTITASPPTTANTTTSGNVNNNTVWVSVCC